MLCALFIKMASRQTFHWMHFPFYLKLGLLGLRHIVLQVGCLLTAICVLHPSLTPRDAESPPVRSPCTHAAGTPGAPPPPSTWLERALRFTRKRGVAGPRARCHSCFQSRQIAPARSVWEILAGEQIEAVLGILW